MKKIIITLFWIATLTLFAEEAPEGFKEKELKPLGGKILVPDDWHFRGGMTKNGFMYILSKEDNPDGTYETGFRIQGIMNIKESGFTPTQATVYNWKRFKDGAKEIVKECDEEHAGIFKKTCLETIQENPTTPEDDFHIIYSFFWNDEIDMIVTGIFGAPESKWDEAEEIYYTIKDFTLIDMAKIEENMDANKVGDDYSE
ncbi:MAG: hypothetical protein ACSHX8_10780 [Opitutaceae bacterium]